MRTTRRACFVDTIVSLKDFAKLCFAKQLKAAERSEDAENICVFSLSLPKISFSFSRNKRERNLERYKDIILNNFKFNTPKYIF